MAEIDFHPPVTECRSIIHILVQLAERGTVVQAELGLISSTCHPAVHGSGFCNKTETGRTVIVINIEQGGVFTIVHRQKTPVDLAGYSQVQNVGAGEHNPVALIGLGQSHGRKGRKGNSNGQSVAGKTS
jgi:hypothetical protein